MRNLCILTATLIMLIAHAIPAQSQAASTRNAIGDRVIAGYIENAWLGEPTIKVEAKLDTGADNSSLNASNYREFKKGSQTYVALKISNSEGRTTLIEKPIIRRASIRRANTGTVVRPVILLKVCVAGVTSEVEFTLTDRSGLSYQILIGRSFLADKILVESNHTFLRPGLCGKG